MTTTTLFHRESTRTWRFLDDVRSGSPIVWKTAIAMLAAAILCMAARSLDARTLGGVSVWLKPTKFFLSFSIHFTTVSWAITRLPAMQRRARGIRNAATLMAASGWLETVYIVFRACRAEASHFNMTTRVDAALYVLMGTMALCITFATAYVGWRLWQQRQSVVAEAAGIGLLLGSILATLAGGYMSTRAGHSVGAAGDLRIAHFIGLHATQLVPIAALSGKRSATWCSAVVICVLTVATFVRALLGH